MTDAPAIDFSRMSRDDAERIVAWRYDEPYAVYNLAPEDLPLLLDAGNDYYAAREGDALIGFCCFGREGRVPGLAYAGTEAVDVGIGLRPDLTGHGRGTGLLTAAMRFGGAGSYRATVAAFNERALRVAAAAGFERVDEQAQDGTGRRFVVLVRPAGAA